VLATATRAALVRLGKAGILPAEEAALLVRADRLWRTILGMLRLTVGRTREEAIPAPAAAAMLRAVAPFLDTPPVDLPGLRTQMAEVAAEVRAVFERRIGPLKGVSE
jgi:glutamate-ammonia-ligase adenylyltransferase